MCRGMAAMQSDTAKTGTHLNRLWLGLDENERDIILCLIHAIPPVSIDTLSALTRTPAVKVLNVMERLRKRKIVYEKKEYQKGIYFLTGSDLSVFVEEHVAGETTQEVVGRVIELYSQSLEEGKEKTLALAELYEKLGDSQVGLVYMRRAADILYSSGHPERAAVYYDYLLDAFSKTQVTIANAEDFLDTVLGKISTTRHLMPIHEQLSLLTRAQKTARIHEKWDYLAGIQFALGQALQAAGQPEKAFRHMNDFWKLAEKIGNPRMLKKAVLLMSDFLHWKGRFAEVVRRYEEVVEDLEEFGEDEATLKTSARVGLCYVRCGRIARGLGMIDAIRVKANMLNLQHVAIFADLMTILALFEIRKISEAEFYLNRISALPEDVVGHYTLWPVEACWAYIYCMNGDYPKAYEYQKKAVEHSRYVGWLHHNGAWNFEYLDILESKGFFYDEWNYDGEIRRMLDWDDIYTRGVALKYRALRNMERQQSTGRVLVDLKNSERYLKKSGAEIELARTRIALGNAYLKKGEPKLAQAYLEKAWAFFSKVDKSLFPKDLLVIMPQEQKIEVMIDRVININESLGTIQDMSSFLERVINVAMDFTMAMRGAFFVLDPNGKPSIVASRNLDPHLLKEEQFKLMGEIILAVARDGSEIVVPDSRGKKAPSDSALLAAGINSVICMEAKLGDSTHGYLYLDNRLGKTPFPDNHLPFVRLFCNQIAVGLSNIKMYEEMRERKDRFEDEAIFYKREMGITNPTEAIVGKSAELKRVIDQVRQVAPTDSSVLILGETGVGKELVAKAIHNLSGRRNGPFIPVNLAALPQDLVASELFGHEKGAFTGANERSKGRFELADGGTIFLDEIGDLPLNVQVKLLRVLQEGAFERLGSAKPIHSDFRVIAATNKDLHEEVEKGAFRQDLFYRLNVFPVHIPPLRERKEDIPSIAHHFIDKFSRKMSKRIRRVPQEELKKLIEYHWPGNVRELSHFIERAVILSDGNRISFSGLHHTYAHRVPGEDVSMVSLADLERDHIEKVLNATYWKISGPNSASLILGLKPTTLLFRMKKLGIKKPVVTL
jgi:transcriptional regulator with GAF, ATPase, and Fis domain